MRIGGCLGFLAPVLSLALVTLAGCPSREISAVPPRQTKEQQKEIPVNVNRDLDILWVIDNSDSMAQEQNSLARNFPAFIDKLETIEGGLPNVHMGVVSSNVGTFGHEIAQGCDGDGDDGVLNIVDHRMPNMLTDCPALTIGGNQVRYIEDLLEDDGVTRRQNYTVPLEDQFSCMAELGTEGCGFEQHLESMRRALSNTDENSGFVRPDAFLAVIFIQDEDDCSAKNGDIFGGSAGDDVNDEFGEYSSFRCFEYGTACEGPANERDVGPRANCTSDDDSQYIESVSTYIDFLRGMKDDPSKVIVAAITAPTTPVNVALDANNGQVWVQPACVVCDGGGSDCSGALASNGDAIVAARPGIRMQAFLDGFPQRSTFQTLCAYNPDINDVDLTDALNQIAALFIEVVGNPCLEGTLSDSDPETPGTQVECRVSDVQDLGLESEQEFPIPSCDLAEPPCFRFVDDPTCMTPANLALEIDRGDPPEDPPLNTTVTVRCLVD